jgi:two-component system, NtrC family, nitrogen regulation response regulator NtrX
MAKILIVDDEASIREALRQLFEYEFHQVSVAGQAAEAMDRLRTVHPDIIFLDVKLPGMNGLELLARIKEEDPGAMVVMISGHGTIDTAVEATRRGPSTSSRSPWTPIGSSSPSGTCWP